MKITENRIIKFHGISQGEVFEHLCGYYMKTESVYSDSHEELNAVHLATGEMVYFHDCSDVMLIDGELVVK